MRKRAQTWSSMAYDPILSHNTLQDLYAAIRADAGLPPVEKLGLINQLQGMTAGMPGSTPLSALMYKGLGGVIGWLISKYFGLGPVGQLVSTLAGAGIGSVINRQLNRPAAGTLGWYTR